MLLNSLFLFSSFFLLLSCSYRKEQDRSAVDVPAGFASVPGSIGAIPLPEGFQRYQDSTGSFCGWLRQLPLKKEKTVYLYNGKIKSNQQAQYAVLDIPVKSNPLLQCADVIMQLRAEYLFESGRQSLISFTDYAGKVYQWKGGSSRKGFEHYKTEVFSYCGSASLEKQLESVQSFSDILPGDVLVQGGFPGHAVLVADMAVNDQGEKRFLLLQGYQPAQDIHILQNPLGPADHPWYKIPDQEEIRTPEWLFRKTHLRRWPLN